MGRGGSPPVLCVRWGVSARLILPASRVAAATGARPDEGNTGKQNRSAIMEGGACGVGAVFRGAVICCIFGRRGAEVDGVREGREGRGYSWAGPAKGTNKLIREPDRSL
jgi:hypothetical protein